jgi:hypothetical protein
VVKGGEAATIDLVDAHCSAVREKLLDDGEASSRRNVVQRGGARANLVVIVAETLSKMLGGASQIVSMIRVKCNGK